MLSEQRRIVAILDEAFDGIATATTNTKKNLQNARALFESSLQEVFSRCENTPLAQIGSVAKVFDGPHATPLFEKVLPNLIEQKRLVKQFDLLRTGVVRLEVLYQPLRALHLNAKAQRGQRTQRRAMKIAKNPLVMLPNAATFGPFNNAPASWPP